MKINGIDSLYKKLNKLKEIEVKEIIENQAKRVRDEARKNVTVDTAELQNSIFSKVKTEKDKVVGVVYTNKEYASYVEFGTGPVGEANHDGISPNVRPMYSPTGWVYYDDGNDSNLSKMLYKTLKVKFRQKGNFIYTKGQPAKPFLYPALHDNQDKIKKYIRHELKKRIKEASK